MNKVNRLLSGVETKRDPETKGKNVTYSYSPRRRIYNGINIKVLDQITLGNKFNVLLCTECILSPPTDSWELLSCESSDCDLSGVW